MKTYFISGGTGSFGKELSDILLKNKLAKKIIIFSRDEFKQDQMKKINIFKKNEKIMRYFIGDVRDKNRLSQALSENKIDIVIHAAALKQVHTTEYNPFETIKTNILGAQNIIESSLENNIKKVIGEEITVSPLPHFKAFDTKCNAAVPEETEDTYLVFKY